MNEVPHRVVIDFQPAPSKFSHEPAQGEIVGPDPLRQPDRMVPRNRLRFVPAHLARCDAAGLIDPLHPVNGRADRDPKLFGGPIAGHATLNRCNHPLPKVLRVRLAHPCWPPSSQHGESETP